MQWRWLKKGRPYLLCKMVNQPRSLCGNSLKKFKADIRCVLSQLLLLSQTGPTALMWLLVRGNARSDNISFDGRARYQSIARRGNNLEKHIFRKLTRVAHLGDHARAAPTPRRVCQKLEGYSFTGTCRARLTRTTTWQQRQHNISVEIWTYVHALTTGLQISWTKAGCDMRATCTWLPADDFLRKIYL